MEAESASGLGTTFGVAEAAGRSPADLLSASTDRYRIIRLLGEGGMGRVFEAEQAHPRRRVALKLIRQDFADAERIRRFTQEGSLLGQLQHPGIAQIYDAGTFETNIGPQPFLALELIRGKPLLEHVATVRPPTRARLDLVARIADGVHHAHQRGIVHRDLKPANILVDANGQPKILDFGIARVVDRRLQHTRLTETGQLVGTLPYMSPEQLAADPDEVDVRSDVYSLGVVLYELLAGRHPFHAQRHSMLALIDAVRDLEPQSLATVSRDFRGDIDVIARKALHKDKSQRYPSAAQFADDLRRHLRDEPVVARRPTVPYQLQKFALRHKVLVGSGTIVFAALVAGITVSTREAARARQAGQVAQAVNEFLQNDLLAQAGVSAQARPTIKADPDLKVRTALERAAARIQERFGSQPVVEAAIRQTMGDTYRDLGLFDAAELHLRRAVELRRLTLGDADAETLNSLHALARVYERQTRYADAERLLLGVLATRRRRLGDRAPVTLTTINDLADVYTTQAKYTQAEPLLKTYLEDIRQARGDQHPDVADGMMNLAALYQAQARYKEAEPLYAKSLEIRRRVLGNEHPDTVVVMNDFALLYTQDGRYADAERLYSEALDIKQRLLGEEHPDTLIGMANLGNLYARAGDYRRAEPLMMKSLAIRRRVLGDRHPLTAVSVNNLATLYSRQGKYEEARPLYAEALTIRSSSLGPQHPDTIQAMNNLAIQFRDEGRYDEAEALQLKAIDAHRRALGENHPRTLQYKSSLATIYRDRGKLRDAHELQQTVLDSQRRAVGEDHLDTLAGLEVLATIEEAERSYDSARSAAQRTYDARRRLLGAVHPDTLRAVTLLARILIRQEQFFAAEALLREATASYEKTMPDNWRRFATVSLLGASLSGQKKYVDAEPLLIAGYRGLTDRASSIPAGSKPFVLEVGRCIAQTYDALGRHDEAAEVRRTLLHRGGRLTASLRPNHDVAR